LATGHEPGDTGDFSNYIYSGFRVTSSNATVTPFLESDPVLRQINDHYSGNYLDETSIVAEARRQGYSTALIGKLGPTTIFDLDAAKGGATLIIDDSTGTPGQEVPLSDEWKSVFTKCKISQTAPARGDNGNSGPYSSPGTWIPNLAQQQYFLEAAVKVALPHFKEKGKPFVLVFWSRDPDGTQHNQGDSFDSLSPGINGSTSLSAIRNADTALATIEQALRSLKLFDTTDIIVAADHGFSVISKTGSNSASIHPNKQYQDVFPGELPLGFLAIDLLTALKSTHARLKLFDPDDSYRALDWTNGEHPLRGNGLLGDDPDHPEVVLAANGGSDLIYLPEVPPTWARGSNFSNPRSPTKSAQEKLAEEIVNVLLEQAYVSGIFIDESRFGKIPGTLSTQAIGAAGGSAVTPRPAIIVSFASSIVKDCVRAEPTLCAAEVADTGLQQGQGMHGSFSRADTWNFMAARGPDFRRGFTDSLPASNADIGMTIARLLNLNIKPNGALVGRVLTESLVATPLGEPMPAAIIATIASKPGLYGLKTLLRTQTLGPNIYFDAAGFAGRTVGLD
jgi:hypothetical protein